MQVKQEHTNSYYAASANERSDFPPLAGDVTADVCVVGAGFTGIATALTLAERGFSVRVVEANRIGWGASGRNGGQMIGGLSGEDRLLKANGQQARDRLWIMGWAGHDIIRKRVEKYAIDCDLKSGYLDVAIKERHLRDFEAEQMALAEHDFPYEFRMLTREETRDAIGTDAYIGAALNMCNGHLHPLNLCLGEAAAAISLGAHFYEQSPVVNVQHGAKPKVITEQGSVTAEFIVLAGNAYQFFDKKLRSRFFPVRSFIIASEPLTHEQVEEVNPNDYAVCDPNFILEYFRLSADKRLLFGGRCRYFSDDANVIQSELRPRMNRIYPQFAELKIDYAWGGTIAVPINRVPQLGRLAKNIFYSQAYSGHGVNVTHLCGEIMADVVGGTLERFDLFSKIKPMRIPGVSYFGDSMTSLGMWYYGLKDKL